MCVCMRVCTDHISFATEGDVHMKRLNKRRQREQERVVVGGSRQIEEFSNRDQGKER